MDWKCSRCDVPHRAQTASLWRALSIRPMPTKVKIRAEALRLKNLHRPRMRVVRHKSPVLILHWFGSVDVRTWCFGCTRGSHSTRRTQRSQRSVCSSRGAWRFRGAWRSQGARLKVLDDLKVFDGLEVYDQLLPNGLADPLGIELLEL